MPEAAKGDCELIAVILQAGSQVEGYFAKGWNEIMIFGSGGGGREGEQLAIELELDFFNSIIVDIEIAINRWEGQIDLARIIGVEIQVKWIT